MTKYQGVCISPAMCLIKEQSLMLAIQISGANAKKGKDVISMSLKILFLGSCIIIVLLAYLLTDTCKFDHKTEP